MKEIFNYLCFEEKKIIHGLNIHLYQNLFKGKFHGCKMSEDEKENHEVHSHKKKVSIVKKIRHNPWVMSTIVLVVLVVIVLVSGFTGSTGKVVSESKASDNLLGFLNTQTGGGVSYVSSEDLGLLYEITVQYNGQDIPVYVTKDGKYYVQGISELSSSETSESTENSQDIPKSDKPVIELFVMSYCPYGTQAEKGILPVLNLLGDKVDFELRFVYYAMHPSYGEVEENLREYCIQKEQEDKFNDYLECFLDEGDSDGCLVEVGIDTAKLDLCYAAADEEFSVTANLEDESSWLSGRYPLFDVDKELNEQYDIGGSPTLIINGEVVSSGRSPAAYLDTICQAFTEGNVPEVCETELISDSYVSGFGWTTSTGTTTDGAQCG